MPQGRCFGLQRCSETPRESFLSSLQRSLLVLGWECPARKMWGCSVRKQGILDKLADPGFAAKDQYSKWHELVHWNDCVIFVVIWEINLVWEFKDSESSFRFPLTNSVFYLCIMFSLLWHFNELTLMLLRLTSVRLLSLLWILSRVSSTLVGFGGSSGKTLKGSGFTTPEGDTWSQLRLQYKRYTIKHTVLSYFCLHFILTSVCVSISNSSWNVFGFQTYCWCPRCWRWCLWCPEHRSTACYSSACTFQG